MTTSKYENFTQFLCLTESQLDHSLSCFSQGFGASITKSQAGEHKSQVIGRKDFSGIKLGD